MPFRGRKVSGVLNSNDSSTNEMSYVDMHDLHPDNVDAAQVDGFVSGASIGATLASLPAAVVAFGTGNEVVKKAGEAGEEIEHIRFTGKNLGLGAAMIGIGAVVMGAVSAFTARKNAETHNAWSERVLSRMEERETAEANRRSASHTENIANEKAGDSEIVR